VTDGLLESPWSTLYSRKLNFFAIYYGFGVMGRNLYSSAVFCRGSTSLHSNFTWTGSSPSTILGITRDTRLSDGGDHILLRSVVLTQYRSVRDRRTGRHTDGRICRSIYNVCNLALRRAVIMWSQNVLLAYNVASSQCQVRTQHSEWSRLK